MQVFVYKCLPGGDPTGGGVPHGGLLIRRRSRSFEEKLLRWHGRKERMTQLLIETP